MKFMIFIFLFLIAMSNGLYPWNIFGANNTGYDPLSKSCIYFKIYSSIGKLFSKILMQLPYPGIIYI